MKEKLQVLITEEMDDVEYRWGKWADEGFEFPHIVENFTRSWGASVNHGDSVTDNEIISVGLICIERKIPIPLKLKKILEKAISRELLPDNLSSWKNKREREEALKALLLEFGGMIKKKGLISFLFDSKLEYSNTKQAREKLLKAVEKMNESSVPISYEKAGFPPIASTLDRLLSSGISEEDANLFVESRKQRLMIISAYLSLNLKLPSEELNDLFDAVEDSWK
ncbi:hypothetical protein HC752_04920 [Vibrio sp. S9_S30]|uniref:hypothetical protein n=1 Tax=Vibrio sp. S9_S30 TaxID=2720226 RepID=UPI00168091A7|nr:hypothetical protein [Vibrio sp. S9_S30]MBD1556272.1 hypothetical protein [Vibrio sp. S9_S30]